MKWIAISSTLLFVAGAGWSVRTPAQTVSEELLQSQRREVLMLRAEVRLLNHRLAERERVVAEQLEIAAEIKKLASRPKELEQRIEVSKQEIVEAREKLAEYRESSRLAIRRRGAGESFSELSLPDGRAYREVTVTRITDVGMEFRHANGSARIIYRELPQDLQQRFQWREEEANRALAREAKESRQLAKMTEQAHLLERERLLKAEAEREARLASQRQSAALAAIYTSRNGLHSSGRLGERRSVGTVSSRRYYRSSGYRRYNTTIYYNRSPRTTTPVYRAPRFVTPRRTRVGIPRGTTLSIRPGC